MPWIKIGKRTPENNRKVKLLISVSNKDYLAEHDGEVIFIQGKWFDPEVEKHFEEKTLAYWKYAD